MRLPLRRLVQVVGVLLLVVVLWTAVALVQARSDLLAARDELEAARDGDGLEQLRERVTAARGRLSDASDGLHRPGPALAARLPVVGRSVAALTITTDAALAVVTAGGDVLQATPDDLVRAGTVDLDGLARVATAAEAGGRRTARPVAELDGVQLSLVPGVVADRVREVREQLSGASESLLQAARSAEGMRVVLGADGDQEVLLMLQNNAELRGTGGLVTVFAQATARGGRLEVQAFRDVQDVADEADAVRRVAAPADYRRLWGPYLADSTFWLNTNMTPDVPTASAVLADVAVASGLRRPDAVVWFDVRAIVALLGATGPVQLPDGSELSADNAVRLLLSDAYADAEDTFEAQAARRAALRGAADAVLTGLLDASPDAVGGPALGAALATAVRGRHLSVWADDDQTQDDLVAGDLAGTVAADGADLASFTVQNFGGGDGEGNKLDYYARRQVTLDVVVERDAALVEQQVTLRNTAPDAGLPRYVAGGVQPGTSRNHVTLTVPAGAEVRSFRRGEQALPADVAPQGDHGVLTDAVSLPPGAQTTWTLTYRLPVRAGRYALQVLPQPLAVDAGLRVDVRAGGGLHLRSQGQPRGPIVLSGPFERDVLLEVTAERPNVLRRTAAAVRRFWTEPVRLP